MEETIFSLLFQGDEQTYLPKIFLKKGLRNNFFTLLNLPRINWKEINTQTNVNVTSDKIILDGSKILTAQTWIGINCLFTGCPDKSW